MPLLLTNPVAIAPYTASMAVAIVPFSGSSTNAWTADHWMKHARMPANSAEPMSAKNGGAFLTVKTTSSAIGSRLTSET